MIKQLEKIQMANRQMACCEISKMPRDSNIDIGNFYAFISCGASPMFSKRIDAQYGYDMYEGRYSTIEGIAATAIQTKLVFMAEKEVHKELNDYTTRRYKKKPEKE